jgi:hypothetical protein
MLFVRLTTLLCFLKVFMCGLVVESEESSLIPGAVSRIFEEARQESNGEVYVVVSSTGKLPKALISSTIKRLKLPVQIETNLKVLSNRRRFFVLILIDDFASFTRIYEQMHIDKFYFNGFFVVCFPRATSTEMTKIFDMLWKIFVYNVVIIDETADVFTFLPFGKPGNCSDVTPVKVNSYKGNWTSEIFFPRKFTNLNKCLIKCGAFSLAPAIIITRHNDGSVALSGFDVDTFNELMKSINAAVKYTIYPVDTGTIYPNGTVTGLIGHTVRGEANEICVAFP